MVMLGCVEVEKLVELVVLLELEVEMLEYVPVVELVVFEIQRWNV